MSTQANSQNVLEIKQKIEDYYSTIHALLCFISLTTWGNGSRISNSYYGFGRRMDSSANNKISPNIQVTPDAVIQRNTNLGYVVEAKKSLPLNKAEWEKYIRQLIKYDDDFIGWWTDNEYIANSCIVLLIEMSRSVEFWDYFNQYLISNKVIFDKKFSLVEFGRADEFFPYYLLRTHAGLIEDSEISETLHKGKKVVIEEVVGTYGQKKFYDSEPEPEFTMTVIWNDIFTDMARNVNFDKNLKAYILEVDLTAVTKELQRVYGSIGNVPREVEFPKRMWVKKAFNGFVRLGYAELMESKKYRVLFKHIRVDILEKFAKQRINPITKKPSTNEKQLLLFENKDERE